MKGEIKPITSVQGSDDNGVVTTDQPLRQFLNDRNKPWKPGVKPDFTGKSLVNRYPELRSDALREALSLNGESKLPANPKQAFGDKKLPLHAVPPALEAYAALGFREGIFKYGYFNYRHIEVEVMTYVAAIKRHLDEWIDGEELTEDSKIPHLAAVAADLAILIDATTRGKAIDNRPPPGAFGEILKRWELTDEQVKYLDGLKKARIEREGA